MALSYKECYGSNIFSAHPRLIETLGVYYSLQDQEDHETKMLSSQRQLLSKGLCILVLCDNHLFNEKNISKALKLASLLPSSNSRFTSNLLAFLKKIY